MPDSDVLWLGYGRGGARVSLDLRGQASRMAVIGSAASQAASMLALAAAEAGNRPCIFDLDGSFANSLSGYFDTYDYRTFLYDSFRLSEPEAWHSQLAAAAYSLALDLTPEEESIINSAMQKVASEGDLLSPVALYDVLGSVEGFRGFYVDKLKGRFGSLRLFDAVDDRALKELKDGKAIVDFQRAPYPQAAELASALFIAKLLAQSHWEGPHGSLLTFSAVHRLFRSSPRPSHSSRLLTSLMGERTPMIFSSAQPESLSQQLLDSCPIRVFSSEAWHGLGRGRLGVLSGSLLLQDLRSAREEAFTPRRLRSKTADYVMAKASKYPAPDVAMQVLEHAEAYPLSTPESVVQFLSSEYLPSDISSALANLQSRRCLILEPKDTGSGPKVFCFTLTEEGKTLLKELRS